MRQEKQRGKGHQSRRQNSAEGSGLFQRIYVVEWVCSYFSEGGEAAATVLKSTETETSAGQPLEMGYADERIHENKGQKGTGRTDG